MDDKTYLNLRARFFNKTLIIAIILLATGIFLDFFLVSSIQTEQRYTRDITTHIREEIQYAENDLEEVINLIKASQQLRFIELRLEQKYPYLIHNKDQLVFWSDNKLVPAYEDISGDYDYKLIHLAQGQYLSIRKTLETTKGSFEVFSFIPVYLNSKISNQYIQPGYNHDIIYGSDLTIHTKKSEGNAIMLNDDVYLFSVVYGDDYTVDNHLEQYLIFIVFLLGFVFLIRWVYKVTQLLIGESKPQTALFFLVATLLFIRIVMLYWQIPFSMLRSDLFDSANFASSSINPSIGDLLLNGLMVLIWVLFLFRHYRDFTIHQWLLASDEKLRKVLSIALMFGSFFLLLGVYEVMMNMQKHAQWSIDISESIDFSSPLKWVSLFIYVITVMGYFALSHVTIKTVFELVKNKTLILIQLGICTLVFMSFTFISKWPFVLLAIVHSGYFLLVYLLRLTENIRQLSYLSFIYLFVSAIACSTVGTYTIYKFSKSKNLAIKQNLASQLMSDEDILGEYLLNESKEKIENDFFIASTFTNYFTSKDVIHQKIRRRHLSNYLDRYDISIYVFDQRGIPITEGSYVENYYQFREKFARSEFETTYDNIYKITGLDAELESGYVVFIPVFNKKFKSNAGFVILQLKLKRLIPNSVYPELLVDKNQIPTSQQPEFGYAIFRGKEIEYSSGLFDVRGDLYEEAFDNPDLYENGLEVGKTMFLGLKGENDKTIIVSSPRYRLQHILANYSFLFLLVVFVVLLVIIFFAILFEYKGLNLNLAAKIQLYLNVAFFLPLFAISITTLSLLNQSYQKQLMNEYFEKAEKISANVSPLLESYFNNQINQESLSNKLSEISKYAESDLNFFNIRGELIASTQPLIYENQLLSRYCHPAAIEAIIDNNARLLIDESVGSLNYKNTYHGVKSFETGRIISILSIPFFASEAEKNSRIIEVLSNIIITFTFIFILFLALSYFASNVLTKPLRYITQKIQKISLSDTNTPMVWNADDEIGLMVGEYNKMLINLEESKKALARSEKESAWREMAQQVAHEIKNPLTPMKLNLQHLKRTMGLNGENEGEEQTNKAINNLLHQIDTLSDIATSFSAFAQMPIPKNERIELTKVVKEATQLHANDKKLNLTTEIVPEQIFIIGDEKMIGRIINNLILNGLQAVDEGIEPEIFVGLTVKEQKAIIEVRDNGSGIGEEIAEKVFIPNFSTKDTGTGIGLAISKRGIEQLGGSIWFETEVGKGTSFYIELPLVD